jgi:NitT/TauT family transport system substrate-binding protein
VVVLAVLVALGLLLAASGGGGAVEAGERAPKTVRFVRGSLSNSPVYGPYNSIPIGLGYYGDEGLDVTFSVAAGSLATIQQLAAGHGDVGIPSPEAVLIARQPDKNIRLVHFYNYNRHNIYTVVVSETSPVRAWADLRGKTLGVSNIASIGTALAKASLRSFGVDPDKDVAFVAVGQGGQAMAALKAGKVDGLALWELEYAAMEGAGLKLRRLVNPAFAKFFSNGIVAREEFLQGNPDAIAGLGRAVAKATVFAMENPEAAVRIHWKVYPDAKPKGLDEAMALKDSVFLLKEALKIFDFKVGDGVRKWGAWDPEEWQVFGDAMVQLGIVKARIPPTEAYTNAFLDRFNAFDAAKVRAQARAYRGE